MDNLDTLLDTNDIFSRISWYEIDRSDPNAKSYQRITIEVHEILFGEGKGKFLALPTALVRHAKGQYIGRGTSVEDALQDCLKKIKGLMPDEIIEK